MEKVKCEDYFIIKIRYYADEHLLKKAHKKGDNLPIQHYERSKLYVVFIWSFIEKVTGKESIYWYTEYSEARECAMDEIQEKYNIRYVGGEGWSTLMIPKEQTEIINWVIKNINLPYKIVKKTCLGYLGDDRDLTWRRKTFSKKY